MRKTFKYPEVSEEAIIITNWARNKEQILPDVFFNENPILCSAIQEYCIRKNITPIFIDRNIAIFETEYRGAYYSKDLLELEE